MTRPQESWRICACYCIVIVLCLQVSIPNLVLSDSDVYVDNERESQFSKLSPDETTSGESCQLDELDCNISHHNASLSGIQQRESSTNPYVNVNDQTNNFYSPGWQIKYIFELESRFKIFVKDKSMDERLANLIALASTTRPLNIDFTRFNSDDKLLEERSLGGPETSDPDDELCRKNLIEMLDLQVEMSNILSAKMKYSNTMNLQSSIDLQMKHLMLAQVLDSFGKYESGLLLGKTHVLGSFKQCISGQLLLGSSTRQDQITTTKFCWANINLNKYLHPTLKEAGNNAIIAVAICIPNSCHTSSFNNHSSLITSLVRSQFKLPQSIYMNENPDVDSIFCPPYDKKRGIAYEMSNFFVLTVLGFISLTIYATIKCMNHEQTTTSNKKYVKNENLQGLWSCLSLKNSLEDFTGQNQPSRIIGRVNLDTINLIKTVSCAFVVLGHSLILLIGTAQDSLKAYAQVQSDPLIYLIISGTIVTDTFFVITGLTIGYISLVKLNPEKKKNDQKVRTNNWSLGHFSKRCSELIAARYLRLIPMYYLVYWFHKSILLNLNIGPLWDYGINKETLFGSCRTETWLTPLLSLSAMKPLAKQCMPHTWSVADDLLFIFPMSPLIVLFSKRRKLATLLTSLLAVISVFLLYRESVATLDEILTSENDFRTHEMCSNFRNYSYVYTMPHYRLFSVLVGLIGGFGVYLYGKTKGGIMEWPSWFTGFATKMSLGFMLSAVAGAPLLVLIFGELPFGKMLYVQSMTTGRFLWSIANAIIFLRMITDWKDTYVMKYWFGGSLWRSMVKLNYGVLLVHVDLIIFYAQSQDYIPLFSKIGLFSVFSNIYLTSYLVSVVMFVFLENPIDKLTKAYILGTKSFKRLEVLEESDIGGENSHINHESAEVNSSSETFKTRI